MPPINILRCWPGSPNIRDGRSHFTPTSCSWLNAVEGAITRYIAATNRNPKPFVWAAIAKTIQAKLTLNHP
jgi:hypothetical protein